jgi:transcriptional regulator with XRE-family HTH domain
MALSPDYKPQPLSPEDMNRPASRLFGNVLLKLRRSIDGHRIEDFAVKLGTTGFNIAQIESNRVAVPPLAVIDKWSNRLELTAERAAELRAIARISGHEDPKIRKVFDAIGLLMENQ